MCGQVGVAIKTNFGFDKKTEDSFYQMLFADTLRGDDSTGVILIEKDSSFGIMKEGYSAPYVIDAIHDSTQGKAMWTKGKCLIGHNRKKTIGAVSDETSHPFTVDGEFAMVHNGTLNGHKQLADTTVDSEALAIHLSKVLTPDFDKEKFEEEIAKVYGAYAVSCYSQKTHSVYLLRNDQRPLSLVETTEGFFWASEMGMLLWVLGRNGITLKDTTPIVLKENTIYRIDLDTNKMEVIEFVPKKAKPVATQKATGKTESTHIFSTPVRTVNGSKRISKQAFKQAKKRWMQAITDFWADDYIEKYFPRTIAEGEHEVVIMGDIDELTFDHTVRADFDVNDLGTNEYSLIDCLYRGRITDMEFDRKTGYVTITVSDAKRVPISSKKVKHENLPALH